MKKSRRLFQLSFIALIIYVIFLIFIPDSEEYPLPDYSKDDIYHLLKNNEVDLNLASDFKKNVHYIDTKANNSIGRYIEVNEPSEKQLNTLKKEVPLYTIDVEVGQQTFQINPENDQVVSAIGVSIPIEDSNISNFVNNYFGEEYVEASVDNYDHEELLQADHTYTYQAKTSIPSIQRLVKVYVLGDNIVGFKHYGEANEFVEQNEDSIGFMLLLLFILLFLITLFIVVTTQLIKRLVKKQIRAFWMPFILATIAGAGWFFLTYAMGGSITGIGMIEPALMTYLTFGTLLIRWKRTTKSFRSRIESLKQPIRNGFLLMIIAITLGELYFLIADYLGGWTSPVLNHAVLINISIWLLPIFALFVGLSAAITEEAIFRAYMIPFFDRFGVFFSVLMSSALWGILHIGYDMYPWYLYIIDFILITGPFFYFVFKKFGFPTVIFLHFFYNSWVTTLFSFSIHIGVGLLALLVTLSPFLLFLNQRKDNLQPQIR